MWLLRLTIRGYQLLISPMLSIFVGPKAGCRFEPSCSQYFLESVETHGFVHGAWGGLKRIGRCHPWGGQGYDPVPPARVIGPRALNATGEQDGSSSRCKS